MRTLEGAPASNAASGTARIQYPDLSGTILIVEDQDVGPLVNLLNRVKDVNGTAMRTESFYVNPAQGMANLVAILGKIETEDVRLVLSDHNLELTGPDGQPIMGALFLRRLADVLGKRRPGETIQLAAYTGFAQNLLRDYGRAMKGIPIIEKGGVNDVVTYCAATLAAINAFRTQYANVPLIQVVLPQPGQLVQLVTPEPLLPTQGIRTLDDALKEIAQDVRANAGVTTPSGMQAIPAERFIISYDPDDEKMSIKWDELSGENHNGAESGSIPKVVAALVSFYEHSTKVRPVYVLDGRPARRSSQFDFVESLTMSLDPHTTLKVTLRVDQLVRQRAPDGSERDVTGDYVRKMVRPIFERTYREGQMFAEPTAGGNYVIQMYIPKAIAP